MTSTVVAESETRLERLDMEGVDDLRVEGVFSVSDKDQTVRFTGPTDGAQIVNDGTIENLADEGRAIRFEEETGATLNAEIVNDGLIHSADDAVQIDNGDLVAGKLLVTNGADGEIRSDDGQALDFGDAGGEFLSRIKNDGLIASGANDGVKIGGVGKITNAGLIVGGDSDGYADGADGVSFEDDASGKIANTGKIEGDRHGVDAGEGSDIEVVNKAGGVLVGHNGSGVGSDGSATVVNHGKITGAFSDSDGSDVNGSTPGDEDGGGPDGINDGDGDGVDIDFEAHIFNYGVIRGTGAGGNGSDGFANTSEGIAAGGGEIVNYEGARIFGADLGILIDDSSRGNAPFETRIENHGEIAGGTGVAIKIVSDLDDIIVNSGRIEGGDGVAIQFGSGDNRLVIEDGSKIEGLSLGGDGVDALDFSGRSKGVDVDLFKGEATGTGGVEGFETVRGSDQGDRIVGAGEDNLLKGGQGDDALSGRNGDDALFGGRGHDTFRFVTSPEGGVDDIRDFNVRADAIALSDKAFDLTEGALAKHAFFVGDAAHDASDRIIYDKASGALFYDPDGTGDAKAVQFATLDAGLKLTHEDFSVV